MPTKTLDQLLNELKQAWDIANNGYQATPRPGIKGRILGPTFSPTHPSSTHPSPGDTPENTGPGDSPNQSFSVLEIRLRQLHQLYETGQITYQDLEREKARILSEI